VHTLAKWSAKVHAASPALHAAKRNAFSRRAEHAHGVVEQVAHALGDGAPALLARTRVRRGRGDGGPEVEGKGGEGEGGEDGEEEVFDDTDFYQQLLRDVIDARADAGAGAGEESWRMVQRQKEQKARRKKAVDTKASKGRKLRSVSALLLPLPLPASSSAPRRRARDADRHAALRSALASLFLCSSIFFDVRRSRTTRVWLTGSTCTRSCATLWCPSRTRAGGTRSRSTSCSRRCSAAARARARTGTREPRPRRTRRSKVSGSSPESVPLPLRGGDLSPLRHVRKGGRGPREGCGRRAWVGTPRVCVGVRAQGAWRVARSRADCASTVIGREGATRCDVDIYNKRVLDWYLDHDLRGKWTVRKCERYYAPFLELSKSFRARLGERLWLYRLAR
jgi:hypothetical protein